MMNDSTLKSILESEIQNSLGRSGSDLAKERVAAMKAYHGEPDGYEQENRSTVVTRDLLETIEWMLPSLLDIFMSSNEPVRFDPEGEEDVESAKQETDMVNHAMMKQNNAFVTIYSWFKDALTSKNGFIHYYWEETDQTRRESYRGLTLDQVSMLYSEPDTEMLSSEERIVQLPDGSGIAVYDIKVEKKSKRGKVVYNVIPPEDMLIHPRATLEMDDIPFIGHKTEMTRSDLVEMGYSKQKIDKLPSNDQVISSDAEKTARYNLNDEQTVASGGAQIDKSRDVFTVYDITIRVDYDDDGKSELRKIIYAGNEILENEETDEVQYATLTPIILTHKITGLSVHDIMGDLQQLSTTLFRNILDNIYLINNQRTEVVAGVVNMGDLSDNRPGGFVRTDVIGNMREIKTTPLGSDVYNLAEYINTLKENRTGITKYNQGLDSKSLNKTATGITKIMDAAQQRILLIARIFAEVGVKRLARGIHSLLRKNQDVPMTVRLRNKWVNVDPADWNERYDATVEVGLGKGNRDDQQRMYSMLLNTQMTMMKAGVPIVSPENVLETARRLAEAAGEKSPDKFFSMQQPQQQPQENPEVIKAKSEADALMGKTQGAMQTKEMKAMHDMKMKEMKTQSDIERRDAEAEAAAILNAEKEFYG